MTKFLNNKRIRKLLEPTAVTWMAFTSLVIVNVSLAFIGFYGFYYLAGGSVVFDYLIILSLWQIGWLYLVFEYIGFDVTDRYGESFELPDPNALGWVLIGVAVLISLEVHYIIASKIAHFYYETKKFYGRRWWIVMLRQLLQGDERAEHTGRR